LYLHKIERTALSSAWLVQISHSSFKRERTKYKISHDNEDMCQEFSIAKMYHVILEQLLFYLSWQIIH